ncbi:hypothetical protein, partial [Caballeronia sp. AZ7_KS35]|uniref:hypothetical protein n=1 Tax=Caballeronia sp. AZ7_KS35 TaxID=2921762 RepID=UPI0020298A42
TCRKHRHAHTARLVISDAGRNTVIVLCAAVRPSRSKTREGATGTPILIAVLVGDRLVILRALPPNYEEDGLTRYQREQPKSVHDYQHPSFSTILGVRHSTE